MGPSGAGKSTLLDVLSGYRIRGIGGSVYTNGRIRNLKEFRKWSCYITQDDRLQPLLTVGENMQIAADLKLPTNVSRKRKDESIKNILIALGLDSSVNTKTSGLSGGQKKRLSIALELICNPMVMFLDEPTTGLDSSSCTTCLKLLKTLAEEGRTIVCTIHQPSASLFNLFDQVYILSAGNCLYQGSTRKLVSFFEDVGFPCPTYHNPADYAIELACEEHGKDKIEKMIKANENGRSLTYFIDELPHMELKDDGFKNESDDGLLATSQFNQLRVLLRRGYIKAKRDQTLTYLRVLVNFLVSAMLGVLYWKSGSDGSRILDNYNLLFAILMHHMFSSMMLTILTVPQEMSILIKEHFNRWYSLKMYYTAITLVDIPLSIVCSLVFSITIYCITAQPYEMIRFMMFFVSSLMVVFVAQSFGLMIGIYFNVVNGTFMGPAISVPIMMFAGFGVRLCDLSPYFYWCSYFSYLRFALEGLVEAVYGLNRTTLECPEDEFCRYKYPKEFLEAIGVRADQFGNDVIALLIFLFVFRISSFVILRYKLMAIR
ncbi:ATP-binding cassette sub-family G member 4 isoform X2 [Leptinotarsa decemlineata]